MSGEPEALAHLLLLLLLAVALLLPIIPMRRRTAGAAGFPFVTATILVLNIGIYFGVVRDPLLDLSVWGLVPSAPRLLSLATHLFFHSSFQHLLGNMVALWLIGPHVEEALGRREYAAFYLGAGMAAGLLHAFLALAVAPETAGLPLVGASGAVFGLLGLFAVRFWRTRVRLFVFASVPAFWAVGVLVGMQVIFAALSLVSGAAAMVAYDAHLGGFAFGALLAIPLRMREASDAEYGREDAEAAERSGEIDLAVALYRRQLARTPHDPVLHATIGRLCAALGHPEAAHAHFRESLRLFARTPGAGASLVHGFLMARQSCAGLSIAPDLLARIASASEESGQFQLAIDLLTELAREHGAVPEGQMALLRLGKLHLQRLEQPQTAAAIFAEFLALHPASPLADHARHLLRDAERCGVA
jgi:membrane associated rhomboid family serine protease